MTKDTNISIVLSSLILIFSLINIKHIKCVDEKVELINNENSTNITTSVPAIDVSNETTTPIVIKPIVTERDLKCNNISEIETKCRNTCQATCEDPKKPACRGYCWRGCECKPGYVKEHQNWTCIPVELCPKCSGANEHFRICGPSCVPTCSNYQNTKPYCRKRSRCQAGCFCDYGFVRDVALNGTCVPIDKCPQKCGPNEYFEEAGAPCFRTIENPRPKCLEKEFEPSCICNTGFIRNQVTGVCEKPSTFVEKCGGNETYTNCGTNCAQKCSDPTKKQFCPTTCLRGCFCNEGYFRDRRNEKCVLRKDCSK